MEEASTMHDWVVWCKSKKGAEEIRPFEISGKKSSLSMMKRNRKRKRTTRTGEKRGHIAGRAYDTEHGGSKTTSKWQ